MYNKPRPLWHNLPTDTTRRMVRIVGVMVWPCVLALGFDCATTTTSTVEYLYCNDWIHPRNVDHAFFFSEIKTTKKPKQWQVIRVGGLKGTSADGLAVRAQTCICMYEGHWGTLL